MPHFLLILYIFKNQEYIFLFKKCTKILIFCYFLPNNSIFPSRFLNFCPQFVAKASKNTFHLVRSLDHFFRPRVYSWTPCNRTYLGWNCSSTVTTKFALYTSLQIQKENNLEKNRRIPSAFWDLRRKLIFPFSHEWFGKVDKFWGPNGTTHEINS